MYASKSSIMRTERKDILIKFYVMQSLKQNKWVLAAVKNVFEEYQVTEVMSANAWLMVSYAKYLNTGVLDPGIEQPQIEMLDSLRESYYSKLA